MGNKICTFTFTTATGSYSVQGTNIHDAEDHMHALHPEAGPVLSHRTTW